MAANLKRTWRTRSILPVPVTTGIALAVAGAWVGVMMPVEAQAPFGTFLCVATCPNGRNYVPNSSVSGPSNCRYAQVDCLSFAGTTLPCDDDVIQMTTLEVSTSSLSASSAALVCAP